MSFSDWVRDIQGQYAKDYKFEEQGNIPNILWGGLKRMGLAPDPWLDLRATERTADFLLEQYGPGGFLSPTSINPEARVMTQTLADTDAFRQQQLSRGLAAGGVNPAMAETIMSESQNNALQALGLGIGGLEGQLQQRRYGAGEQLLNVAQAEEAEVSAREEERRRYEQAQHDAKRAQMMNTVMGLAGLGIGAYGAFSGGPGAPTGAPTGVPGVPAAPSGWAGGGGGFPQGMTQFAWNAFQPAMPWNMAGGMGPPIYQPFKWGQ